MLNIIIGTILLGSQTVIVCALFKKYFENNASDYLKQFR